MMSLFIRTLGAVTVKDGPATVHFESRNVTALFIYLACNQYEHSREVLADMFGTGVRGSGTFRRQLYNLRTQVGQYIYADNHVVRFRSEALHNVDALQCEAALARFVQCDVNEITMDNLAAVERALDLFKGDFAAGLSCDSRQFEMWASLKRERLRFLLITTLDVVVDYFMISDNLFKAVESAHQLMGIDPLRSETHRKMMRIYALAGNRGAAMRWFEQCTKLLREELGVEPTRETIQLYEQIKQGEIL